jgi:radical SAM protein with 4Fe4S-binding SPASM domain
MPQNIDLSKSTVKPVQYYRHLFKALLKYKQLPSYFIFYPTSRCNLKCSHCFYHDSLNKKFNELSLDEIDKITKTMDPILSLILTGGEPYLRHDLDKIVKIFYENTRVPIITIPSNGWYLNKMDNQITNMMEWCPYLTLNQQISIDGVGADHDLIRMDKQVVGSDNSFERAIKTIHHLKKLQKTYNRINIGIIITFTNQNQKKFKNIIKEVHSLVEPDNISINLVRGDPKQKVNLDLDLELYRDAVKYRDDLYYEKKMSGHSRFKGNKLATAGRIMLNELTNKTFEENKYSTPCYAGNLSGVMYPEGDIYPCEILDDSHKIGNIRDFGLDFKKLWLSKKAKEEVDFIKKTKCFCTHECFNSVNILFNPKFYPEIIKKSSLI